MQRHRGGGHQPPRRAGSRPPAPQALPRQVVLDRPGVGPQILDVHVKGQAPRQDGRPFDDLARRSPGFSGADLANLSARPRSWLHSTTRETIPSRTSPGGGPRHRRPRRRSQNHPEDEKKIIAYRGGHAVVSASNPGCDGHGSPSCRGHGSRLHMSLPRRTDTSTQDRVRGQGRRHARRASPEIVFEDTTTRGQQ
jgi:cell division protease FtsH